MNNLAFLSSWLGWSCSQCCQLQRFREGHCVGEVTPVPALAGIPPIHPDAKSLLSSLLTRFVFPLCLGNVTTSTSVSQMASGISLVSFNSRPDGMHQRSYSVSSADQWSEATVIANSGISSGKRPAAWGVNGDFGALACLQTNKQKRKLCPPRWNVGC